MQSFLNTDKGDRRPRIPACVIPSSAMEVKSGGGISFFFFFFFLPTTHAKTNIKLESGINSPGISLTTQTYFFFKLILRGEVMSISFHVFTVTCQLCPFGQTYKWIKVTPLSKIQAV